MGRTEATSFAGAHVLLTGASRGLGAALADELAGRGARLSLVARDVEALTGVAARTGGAALPSDLTDLAALAGLAERARDRHGPVDVLLNNAATFWLTPLAEQTADQLAATLTVNLVAPAELIRSVLPEMRARGRGHIVNVGSLGGIMAIPGLAAYGASKAGLAHLTEVLRAELAGGPIGLTLVQLAAVEGTDMYHDGMRSPMIERVVRRMGRVGLTMSEPAEMIARRIADAVEQGRSSRVVPRLATAFHLVRRAPIAVAAALDTHRR